MYSPESSSKSPPRFRNSGPVLFPLHPVHSELAYVRVSKLPSTYPLSSSLHSCTFINLFQILGSSEAVFPPLGTLVAPEHSPKILFLLRFRSFPFSINILRLPSCTLVQILTETHPCRLRPTPIDYRPTPCLLIVSDILLPVWDEFLSSPTPRVCSLLVIHLS